MTTPVILAIDQGTTGTTALLINSQLEIKGKANCEYAQIYPQPGWVEHEPKAIWTSVQKAVSQALSASALSPSAIKAIGITNQRETTCLFNRQGEAVHNFIVWQCRRTTEICEQLKSHGWTERIAQKTGLVLDPYFSGTKLMWLFQHLEGTLEKAQRGELLFGTIDSWLTYQLSGHRVHVTDTTNASRTLLMNLATCAWDQELLSLFGVPADCLPTICSSSEIYGYTHNLDFLPDGIPISGIAGDQQAALFGQACFEPGEAKVTYGTGAFMLLNTGQDIIHSRNGLLTSVAITLGKNTQYCLEGAAFIAGAAVQWLRDNLGLIKRSADIEQLAQTVPDSGEVTFVPALAGLGAPYWNPHARGLFKGISRATTKGHLARAVLEGIALQNYDILNAMRKDFGKLTSVKVDGGAAANNLLMQFQADILGIPCIRPKVIESTALGAAALAGLSTGIFSEKKDFLKAWQPEKVFEPHMAAQEKEAFLRKWEKAINCV